MKPFALQIFQTKIKLSNIMGARFVRAGYESNPWSVIFWQPIPTTMMATRKILLELRPHLAAQIKAKNESRPKDTSKEYMPKQQAFMVRQSWPQSICTIRLASEISYNKGITPSPTENLQRG